MARILVSDDHSPSRELYRDGLERVGHRVFTAADGEEAYHLFLDLRPDVLLTDWHMPRLSGFDLVLLLRRLGYGVPVILLSGGSSYLHGYLNDIAILKKPTSPEKLSRLVDAMTRR